MQSQQSHADCMHSRFDDLYMEERMEAIGEIIMEQGYPTVLYFQVITTSMSSQSLASCVQESPIRFVSAAMHAANPEAQKA